MVNLEEDLDLWLAKQTNQNETVRKALYLYKDDISTPDTIAGLKKSYVKLGSFMQEKFKYYDKVFADLEKLVSYLETRM